MVGPRAYLERRLGLGGGAAQHAQRGPPPRLEQLRLPALAGRRRRRVRRLCVARGGGGGRWRGRRRTGGDVAEQAGQHGAGRQAVGARVLPAQRHQRLGGGAPGRLELAHRQEEAWEMMGYTCRRKGKAQDLCG